MGLDSVELVLAWEDAFDVEISDEDASKIRTTGDSIDCVCGKLQMRYTAIQPCPSVTAFGRIRKAFERFGVARNSITPEARISDLIGKRICDRRMRWVLGSAGMLPIATSLRGRPLKWLRVRDLVEGEVASQTRRRSAENSRTWSRVEVREAVRAVTSLQTGVDRFKDDDDIVRDLGID